MLRPPAGTFLPVENLLAAKTLEEAASVLAGTPNAEPVAKGLQNAAVSEIARSDRAAAPLTAVEIEIDRWFLSRLAAASTIFSGHEARIVRRLIGVVIDVNNVLWTERLRRTFHFPPEETARRLCPAGFYFATAKQTATLAQWSGEGQAPLLGLEQAGPSLRLSMMRMLAREARRPLFATPFQAGVPLSYLILGQLELADLVALYEGRRWGRDTAQLADALIRFYGTSLAGGEVAYQPVVKVVAAEKLPMVMIGDGDQRTAAMSGRHAEIVTSQRRVAPRSIKSAAMTVAGRSCSPRGVPRPIRWRMTSPRLKPPA